MDLRPLSDGDLHRAAGWLAEPDNARWLHFAPGVQSLDPIALGVMRARDLHVLRVFSAEPGGPPIGLVALSDVDRSFKTARLWYVLGEKRYGARGYTTRAVAELLRAASMDLALNSVNAWVVDGNVPSARLLERNGFRLIGRQRACHYIDGQLRDRLLFDLVTMEHGASS